MTAAAVRKKASTRRGAEEWSARRPPAGPATRRIVVPTARTRPIPLGFRPFLASSAGTKGEATPNAANTAAYSARKRGSGRNTVRAYRRDAEGLGVVWARLNKSPSRLLSQGLDGL